MSDNNTTGFSPRVVWLIIIALVSMLTMLSTGVFIGKDEAENIISKKEAMCDSDLRFCNKVLDNQNKVLVMQELLDRIKIARPEHMEIGGATLEVGRFASMDKAKEAEFELRKYLADCSKLSDTWFCHPDLLNMISVLRHNEEDFFLVIKGLNLPTLYNLCAFMWTYSARVRAARHSCSQMSLHEMHEMGL